MLRKYLHDFKLEQLAVPCVSITVDLVEGNFVVREQGDAILAILESINLPVLSVPICRDGQALIDGGIVNNIPADVLVSMGCNFVIAGSVTAKMQKEFCDITRDKPAPRRKPSLVQTLLRSLEVQNYSLNAFGVGPADVVIAPDVRGVDLTEFVRAKERLAMAKFEIAAVQLLKYIQENSDGFRILVRDSNPTSGSGTFASLISDIASQVEHILADVLKSRGYDPKLAPVYGQMLVGMVAFAGQWWLDARKPKLEEMAAHLVNLAWNGLSQLDPKPRLSPEALEQLREGQ